LLELGSSYLLARPALALPLFMEALLQWVYTQCENDKYRKLWQDAARVGLVTGPTGDRTMVATAMLSKGLRLPLPPKCILTEEKVETSPVGKALQECDRYTQFAVFLVGERRKGATSFWAPYVNLLPQDISFHPITFLDRQATSPALEKALSEEPLLKRALESQHAKLRDEFNKSLAALQDVELFKDEPLSYEEFVWGNCMVVSRAFEMLEPKLICMLPFTDMMNHTSKNPSVLWRPKLPHGYFVITLVQSLKEGQELNANYHGVEARARTKMDEMREYVMYGFVESGNFRQVQDAAAPVT